VTHPERVGEYLDHIREAINRAIRYGEPLDDAEELHGEE